MHLIVEEAEPITWLTLDHPARRNALSLEVMRDLTRALESAQGRVVVIAGNGPCFSAGHDLNEILGASGEEHDEIFTACTTLMETVQAIAQPVIAAVHGVATAAGCQLVASCDLVVATDDARFATPGVNIGLFCTTPMVPITRVIGPKRAMQMLLTGDLIDARTAQEWGLVNEVVAPDDLHDAAEALARKIAEASPMVVALGKRAFYRQRDIDQARAYELAVETMTRNAATRDAQEGIGAFLEKRPPKWTGE